MWLKVRPKSYHITCLSTVHNLKEKYNLNGFKTGSTSLRVSTAFHPQYDEKTCDKKKTMNKSKANRRRVKI